MKCGSPAATYSSAFTIAPRGRIGPAVLGGLECANDWDDLLRPSLGVLHR